MRISALQEKLAVVIDNAAAGKWGVRQMVTALNDGQRSLVRIMADVDENYVNFRFTIPLASMRTVHGDEFAARLPPWVMKVTGVRENAGTGSSRQPLVPRARKWGQNSGWQQTAGNELAFYRMGSPRSFDVEAAKLPALMTKGMLPDQTGMAANQMRLDPDPALTSDYPHETFPNSYAGGLFEITGPTTGAPAARIGQLLRGVASTHGQLPLGTIVTLEENWASVPAIGDTYEMHAEIADQHLHLLVLWAARRCFAQAFAVKGLAALAPEYSEEMMAFKNHVATRDLQEPYYIQEGPYTVVPSMQEYQ